MNVIQENLNEIFQSAYKPYHSTETALTRVHNDVMRALDSQQLVILLLLDLSAAFDTVDHTILMSRLSRRFGFKDGVLKWFSPYISERKHFVSVNGGRSTLRDMPFGLPQGSVLGPVLFLLYTAPIAAVIRKHNIGFHLYADDTQIYITSKSSVVGEAELARTRIEACVCDIDKWMLQNTVC